MQLGLESHSNGVLTWLCVASCGSESFLLVDMSWQEGHHVTPDLSEGLCCEGSDDMLYQILLRHCNNTQL